MSASPHVVLAGGGTAGHLFPGLALAHALRERHPEIKITFATVDREFEREILTNANETFVTVPAEPLPQGPARMLWLLTRNWSGYAETSKLLTEQEVSLVVGLGGYASIPTARAAIRNRIPLILMEPNVVPDTVTRWLAPAAKAIAVAFREVQPLLPAEVPLHLTGTPVRRAIASLANTEQTPEEEHPDRKKALLVLGGVQGEEEFNQTVPYALYRLRKQLNEGWHILHQSGYDQLEATRTLYRKFDLHVTVMPVIKDVASILKQGDVAIARAGGSVLAELACAGVPSLLLPSHRIDEETQLKNAKVFQATGAAELFEFEAGKEHQDHAMALKLADLISNQGVRLSMHQKMRSLAFPQADRQFAALVSNHLNLT
ncbi:UDP-N-acetylglucosamine--N-acetylmuramyl-(pentapeptide) pyrophosphoryl-undecaprenol N-acetylglucosamine transferase [Planctomycetales bacterium 10988]|nr:UDP-N-acetylglucosamine--N-acetylmuramyl-(pentapeptide) pyrophosphoryl-undecaprenol N-acetylglucosamine transferase [Planctomycetales bacterium 10988]